jgi:hypothetical protein
MKFVLLILSLASATAAMADDGKCVATGRVGGEDIVCAKYDNTDQATCEQPNRVAWCSWQAAAPQGAMPAWLDFSLSTGVVDGLGMVQIRSAANGQVEIRERALSGCEHSTFPNPCDPLPPIEAVTLVHATMVHESASDEPTVIQLGERYQLKRGVPDMGMGNHVQFTLVRMSDGKEFPMAVITVINEGLGR